MECALCNAYSECHLTNSKKAFDKGLGASDVQYVCCRSPATEAKGGECAGDGTGGGGLGGGCGGAAWRRLLRCGCRDGGWSEGCNFGEEGLNVLLQCRIIVRPISSELFKLFLY
ncbi:uncharacterized protein BcabD6B2_14300 [Babesia caballi]|uniref:Uncharacterized protein n=1 Tax=Babesia caballi TaxID=5871 RepID=A0AAV4LR66_BABCB|nr:hypothetical protein BcabD6B2_14300 [Babesia caballi]